MLPCDGVASVSPVRQAAVAGSWYPSSPDALARIVDAHLAGARGSAGEPVAIIAPHAGLAYSGPIAAHAYKLLRNRPIDVAVIVGPSHFVAFEGVAIYARGTFATPLGAVPIDEERAAALQAASPH